MFWGGYIDILTATSDTPLARQLSERLARHVGLHLATFSTAGAAAEHRRLAASAFPVLPLVDMRLRVATREGEAWARLTIARIAAGVMPEGRMQFLTHHTEALVWREGFLYHPNGALALAAVWVATKDPAEAADRFRRFTGRPTSQEDEVSTIALERGAVRIATPEFLARAVGVEPGPLLPYLAASEIQVVSLPRLHDHFDAAALAYAIVRDAIAVSLPPSVGGTLLFRQFPV